MKLFLLLALFGVIGSEALKLQSEKKPKTEEAKKKEEDDSVKSMFGATAKMRRNYYVPSDEKKVYTFSDPNHPGGHRQVKLLEGKKEGGKVEVTGTDKEGDEPWTLIGRFENG